MVENHRKTIGKPYENGDLMRFYGGLMGFNGIYPAWQNVYITNWKITMLLMGKSTILMAIFSSLLYVYQRVT
jgi:hypothetical protein